MIRERALALLLGCLSVAVLIVVWQALVDNGTLEPSFVGSPRAVARAAQRLAVDGTLLADIGISSVRVLIGFALCCAVAVPLGLLIGMSAVLKAALDPVVSLIRPLPSLSWIPLSIMWLGIGEGQKYAIVFMGSFAPTLVFVMDATRRVDPVLLRAARNLGASRSQLLLHVVLPATLPSILSALKVTLAIAWACIISAEMVGSTSGLGFLIWNAKDWGNIAQVLVGMLTISTAVLLLDQVHRASERKLIPWQFRTSSH